MGKFLIAALGENPFEHFRARIYLIISGDGGPKAGAGEVEDNSDETFALELRVATDRPGGKYNSPVLLNIDPVGNWNFRPNSYFCPVFLCLPAFLLPFPSSCYNPFYSRTV